MTDSEIGTDHALVPAKVDAAPLDGDHRPLDQHPALVYIVRLAPGSWRTMRQALTTIAHVLGGGRCTVEGLAWAHLRYQHVAALRQILAARFKPATVNKAVAALRGVLKESWRLGLMAADDYERAADVSGVKSSTEPRVRRRTRGEVVSLPMPVAANGDGTAPFSDGVTTSP